VTSAGTEGMITADRKSAAVRTEKSTHHLNVCICTFKRAVLLRRLLDTLVNQRTEGLFSFSVVVADNDAMQSAQPVVDAFSSVAQLPVAYCFEPQANIAMARNKALANVDGDFAVFIDDDEFPAEDWLLNLYKTCSATGAAGVLGPVKPSFEPGTPGWVKKGGFFDRPSYATGYELKWPETRTGNVLFKKEILSGVEKPFRVEFATAGEDMDFFRRMMEKGHRFVWCDEAVAYETVPLSRCTRSHLLKRALLRGSNFPKHPSHRVRNIVKSLIAVPSYTLALPILFLLGQHVFIKYLSKLLDHSSRLLAFVGLPVMKQRET
jgi:succinoglycan biosynthesis protein ExoM